MKKEGGCRKREGCEVPPPPPPPPLLLAFKFTQPSQMAVFSCMRLEDVSDSRCRFPGKLIFQAKLFLFWRSSEVVCVCICVCYLEPSPLLLFKREGGILPTDCR